MISRMKKSISSGGNKGAQHNSSENDTNIINDGGETNGIYRRSRSVGRLRVRSTRGVSPSGGAGISFPPTIPVGGGSSGQNEGKSRGHDKKQKQKRGGSVPDNRDRDRHIDGDTAQQNESKNNNSSTSEAGKASEEKVEGSVPDTLVSFEKNRSTLKKLKQSTKTFDGVNVTLPSLTVEQVMLLSVSPPGKSSELHHMIDGRQWTAVRIKLKLLKGDQTPKKLTSAGVAASATNITSVTDVKPIKSSTSLMKALLQRDELGRTPLHLILQRRSTGTSINGTLSMKKAPPDIIVGLLHSCPRASSIPDIENNYPLHIAVLNGHRTDIVRLLVHCYPGALLETNVNLDTPLILAANFSISLKPSSNGDSGNQTPKIVTPHSSPQAVALSLQNTMLNDDEVRTAFATSPRWELVSLFLQHHPESAQIRNSHDMSVLEMALQRHAPAYVIRMLLRADKSAASIQRRVNLRGGDIGNDRSRSEAGGSGAESESSNLGINVGVMTPLNLAIMRHASVHVLGLLALAFPNALHVRDQWGLGAVAKCWIDWYYESSEDDRRAIRRETHVQLLANLVQARDAKLHPSLATVWMKIQTLLCVAHYPDSIKNRNFHDSSSSKATKSSGRDGKGKTSGAEREARQDNTTDTLLDHASNTDGEEDTAGRGDGDDLPVIPPFPYTFRPVHAAASHDCPLEILNLALVLHPNQCTQRDEQGSTPLHLAAAAPLYTKQSFEPALIPPVERLIRMDASAACMTDSCGRLPLHIAVDSGKKWNEGVSALVAAEPRALNSPDPFTSDLYPALSAASRARATPILTPATGYTARSRVGEQRWNSMSEREKEEEISHVRVEEDRNSLTTIFELLRSFPLVVSKTLREKEESISCLALIDGPTVGTLGPQSPLHPALDNEFERHDSDNDIEVEEEAQVQHGVADWNVDDLKNNLMFDERQKPEKSAKSKEKHREKLPNNNDTTEDNNAKQFLSDEPTNLTWKDDSNVNKRTDTYDIVEGGKTRDKLDRKEMKHSLKSHKRNRPRRYSTDSIDHNTYADLVAASNKTMDPEGERVMADFGTSKSGYDRMKSIVARGMRDNLRSRSSRCVSNSSKTNSETFLPTDLETPSEKKDLLQVDASKLMGETQNMTFLTPQPSLSRESDEGKIPSHDIQNDVPPPTSRDKPVNANNNTEKKKKLVSLPKFVSRSSSNATAANLIEEVDRDEKAIDEGIADWSLQDIKNTREIFKNDKKLEQRQSNTAGLLPEPNGGADKKSFDALDPTTVEYPSSDPYPAKNECIEVMTPFDEKDETAPIHSQRVDSAEDMPGGDLFSGEKVVPKEPLPLATSTRKSHGPISDFKEEEDVLYRDSKGNVVKATVMKVHFDDELVPYYDILLASGKEKQTDDNHLSKFSLAPANGKLQVADAVEKDEIGLSATGSDALKGVNPFAKNLVQVASQEPETGENPFDAFTTSDAPSIQPLDLFSDYEESFADDNPFDMSDDHVDQDQAELKMNRTEASEVEAEALPAMLTCTACSEKQRDVVLLPCRHLCVCFPCSVDTEECPICRQEVKDTLHVLF